MRPRSAGGLRSIARTAEKKAIGRERKSGLLSAAAIVPIVASLTNRGTARAAGFLPVLDLKIIDLGKDAFAPVKLASHSTAH